MAILGDINQYVTQVLTKRWVVWVYKKNTDFAGFIQGRFRGTTQERVHIIIVVKSDGRMWLGWRKPASSRFHGRIINL